MTATVRSRRTRPGNCEARQGRCRQETRRMEARLPADADRVVQSLAHVEDGKIECKTCHGDTSPRCRSRCKARILNMKDCMDATLKRSAPNGCDTCPHQRHDSALTIKAYACLIRRRLGRAEAPAEPVEGKLSYPRGLVREPCPSHHQEPKLSSC